MGLWKDRLVFGALVVSESAWVFVVLGSLAVATGGDQSPLSWPALLLIMGLSLLLGRLGRLKYASVEVTNLVRALIGAATVYLAISARLSPGAGGVDMGWIGRLGSDTSPEGFTFNVLAGAIAGTLLWWRAGALAATDLPAEALGFSFRVGIFGFAVAALIDISQPADLSTFPMSFIFFAAGLLGLSVGNLMPESRQAAQAKTWQKVIGGLVSSVLLVGLLFGLLQKTVLETVLGPILAIVGTVVKAFLWIIIVPLAFLLNVFFAALISFFDKGGDFISSEDFEALQAEEDFRLDPTEFTEEVSEELPPLLQYIITIIEWAFVALVVLILLYLLSRVLRRVYYRLFDEPTGARESVIGEVDPMMDIARLLMKLLPHWARRKRAPGFNIPDGPPGVVAVLKVYYQLLALAEKRGVQRLPHETATEFQDSLATIFPRDLVSLATETFNSALYGYHPATTEQISALQSSLKGLAGGPA